MSIPEKRGIFRESAKDKRSRLWTGFKDFCKNVRGILKDWQAEGEDHFKPYYAIIFPLVIIAIVLVIALIVNSFSGTVTEVHDQDMNQTTVNITEPEPEHYEEMEIIDENDEVDIPVIMVSFDSVLGDIDAYHNQFINITGYINYVLIDAEYVKILEDDYGNQLKLTFYTDYPRDLFVLNNRSKDMYFIYGKFRNMYPLDTLDVYDLQIVYNSNLGAPCNAHEDCVTPMEFMIQSNCPFGSACIENRCKVVCPFAFHDPDPNVNKSYPVPCKDDWDCDCSMRGERSILCMCLDGGCVSVEAE